MVHAHVCELTIRAKNKKSAKVAKEKLDVRDIPYTEEEDLDSGEYRFIVKTKVDSDYAVIRLGFVEKALNFMLRFIN